LSLEKEIKEKEKNYLIVVEEMRDLTRRINDLEAEVEHKSNVIRKRDKEIAEKEQEVRKAIPVVLLMPFELLLGNRSVPPVVLLMSCELFLGNRSVPPVVLLRKRDKEIAEKEQEVRKAIEESNGLRLKIDKLQEQQSKSMVEDKEMSKKIEILEDELADAI
jgi:predicted  nucleic acid-binding Zn-ribbon protein